MLNYSISIEKLKGTWIATSLQKVLLSTLWNPSTNYGTVTSQKNAIPQQHDQFDSLLLSISTLFSKTLQIPVQNVSESVTKTAFKGLPQLTVEIISVLKRIWWA